MSDQENKTADAEVIKVDAESLLAEIERYKIKHAEQEKHRKEAERKLKELQEAQRQQEEDSLKQREEFKTLYEREQKSRSEVEEKYSNFARRVQEKEIEIASMSLAGNLTRDTKRAALIKKEIAQFAHYTEDGVKFEIGGVEVDQKKLTDYITENFPFLVDGSGASGGGATGGSRSGASMSGNMGGSKQERVAAIAARFNLNT